MNRKAVIEKIMRQKVLAEVCGLTESEYVGGFKATSRERRVKQVMAAHTSVSYSSQNTTALSAGTAFIVHKLLALHRSKSSDKKLRCL